MLEPALLGLRVVPTPWPLGIPVWYSLASLLLQDRVGFGELSKTCGGFHKFVEVHMIVYVVQKSALVVDHRVS